MEENKTQPEAVVEAKPAENTAVATPETAKPANRGNRNNNFRGNRDNKGGNKDRHGRRPRMEAEKEFDEQVVKINRVTKVVKGGRRYRFAALVVIGDKKGRVGMGTGKANEVPDAIKKAVEAAQHNIIKINIVQTSVPHEIIGQYGACRVMMKPACEGTGVIAGGPVRSVMELAGISNVLTKCLGSRTKINMIRATFDGLQNMKTLDEVSKLRGLKPSEVRH